MALERSARPVYRHINSQRHVKLPIRSLATTTDTSNTPTQPPPPPASNQGQSKTSNPNPNLVHTPRSERRLLETKGQYPIASRRRRAALANSSQVPFTQLPYQCFQEARKILAADRAEKVEEIKRIRERIDALQTAGDGVREGETGEQGRIKRENIIRGLKQRLEKYKIYADINDPIVKKKFEDGQGMTVEKMSLWRIGTNLLSTGDMNKPIYRHLAHLQWSSYKRKVLMQRITQMNMIPDVLPTIDPSVSTILRFGRKKVPHGDFVLSTFSERPPNFTIQPYDAGERLVSIAVVNPDVPNVEKDGFEHRCHFLASNVRLSPTETEVDLSTLDPATQVVIPWLPAYAQKGLPYQRMCIFVLQQHAPASPSSTADGGLDLEEIRKKEKYTTREGFNLRSFVDTNRLKPVGADLFRTQWDEGTAGVMARAGIVGADVAFKRKRIEPLPYKRLKGERFT